MSEAPSGYEFNAEQDKLIGSLAGKMSFVGLLALILGLIDLFLAVLVVTAVYRERLPAELSAKTKEYMNKAADTLPESVRAQVNEYTVEALDKLPANNHLWGIAIAMAISGLVYFLLGIWTRSAATSFRKIVDTQGNDIKMLMDGLTSLHHMFSLIYTLLMIVVFAGIVALGLTIYSNFLA